MSAPSLLGPNARPMVQLGGDAAWKVRNIKGITCSFQWLDLRQWGFEDTDEHACVPCMVLFRAETVAKGAYVIPQPLAFRYGDNKGNPTHHLITSGFAVAQDLGYDMRDKQAIKACIDIIIEALPDLILMPSEPPSSIDALAKREVRGILATAKINGRVIHSEEL